MKLARDTKEKIGWVTAALSDTQNTYSFPAPVVAPLLYSAFPNLFAPITIVPDTAVAAPLLKLIIRSANTVQDSFTE